MANLTFFADHCISTFIIQRLRDVGYHVLRLQDHIPADSPDSTVIQFVQEQSAILISLNGDFADIITYPPSKYHGIIALQIRNHPEIIPDVMDRLISYLSKHNEMHFYQGKLFIVEVHRIRIRQ